MFTYSKTSEERTVPPVLSSEVVLSGNIKFSWRFELWKLLISVLSLGGVLSVVSVIWRFTVYYTQTGGEEKEKEKITKNPFADYIPSFRPVDLTGDIIDIILFLNIETTTIDTIFRATSRGSSSTEHAMARNSENIWPWLRNILPSNQSQRLLCGLCL